MSELTTDLQLAEKVAAITSKFKTGTGGALKQRSWVNTGESQVAHHLHKEDYAYVKTSLPLADIIHEERLSIKDLDLVFKGALAEKKILAQEIVSYGSVAYDMFKVVFIK